MGDVKNYVVGFLFDGLHRHVVLIRKNRPDWQRGKLNGVGGHIEDYDETPHAAMVREFKEETGADISKWYQFAEMEYDYGHIFFFTATGGYDIRTTTDERVDWYRITELHQVKTSPVLWDTKTIKNLKWLIPLALDPDDVTVKITDLTIGHPNTD